MKTMVATLLFFITCSVLLGQRLKLESYQFVSKAHDTVQAELGSFKVLEDRTNGGSDSIQLSFIRFKSTNPKPGNPIVYLAGGPGGTGTGAAKGARFKLFMMLREVADVIAFDQRGTGISNQLPDCPCRADFLLHQPIDKKEYVAKTTANISKCLKFWEDKNVNLHAYNTMESANDLEDLRKALKIDKISLWGISYGSHLAFEYIRRFEQKIDKMVLASLEGPNETIKFPKEAEDFLFNIAELAKHNNGSENKYPNLKHTIIEVHKRLKRKPVVTSYKNRKGTIDTVGISNFELQAAMATFYLKNPNDAKKIPYRYSQMYAGNFSEVAIDVMVIKRYIFSSIRPMSFAMDMQSGITKERQKEVERQINRTILGSTINFLSYEWMTNLDFEQLPDEFRKLKSNKVDALLLSGTMDGRTYVNSGKEIAEKFENGKHVIIENGGHDLYMQSPEIGNMVVGFFKGKDVNLDRVILEPMIFE
ncbi:alpha/beta fold hydrolase [uncultured Kriegella sp.]|uniref:alpha/beta hydrolase n=1 Tax=uncultured Kriegella sp. TaxID=1798910 RepID=UPI0030DB77CA|tara:strand:+ start:4245 stop:5675 length:1431 start_codon:yes stop_codon:yes gene_type:complete